MRFDSDWPLAAGLDWVDSIMSVEVTDRYHAKQGRSIGRWALQRPGTFLVVYLKRHFALPRWDGLFAAVFPGSVRSPGLGEWYNIERVREFGLPVPRAVAAGEFLGPWGRLQSFIAVEELSGMLPLHEAVPLARRLLSSEVFSRWKRGLIAEMARLCTELHRRRLFHQDLYLCHFYIAESDCHALPDCWSNRIWMIDFHRLSSHKFGWAWWQAKDLGQLLFSTFDVEGISARDRLRFWRLYREGAWGHATPPTGWIGRAARWRASRYLRHNARQTTRIAK